MIHYELICGRDHEFDGWFRDSATFDRQVMAGMLACPACGDVAVRRALMAPAIGRRRSRESVVQPGAAQAREAQSGAAQAGAAQSGAAQSTDRQMLSGLSPQPSAGALAGAVLPDQVRALLQRMRAEVETSCEHVGDRFAQEARAIHNGEAEARGIYGEATPEQAEALADDGIEIARIPWIPRADG